MAQPNPMIPKVMATWCGFNDLPEIGERDVVVVNNPSQLSTIAAPFYRAYEGLPLPRTIRTLVPGIVGVQVQRPDDFTLIIKAKETDLFGCPDLGPVHIAYLFRAINDMMAGGKVWTLGDRVIRKGMVAEVLELGPRGAPSTMAFHFAQPLEVEGMVWMSFDWSQKRYVRFKPPEPKEAIELAGAGSVSAPSVLDGYLHKLRPSRWQQSDLTR